MRAALHDLCTINARFVTVEKLLGDGGQIVILGVRGGRGECGASIGFSIVSVYGGGRGAVLSVYCQYLGVFS